MKEHAMDACEHLYSLESEVRERRSLDNHLYNHKHKKCKYKLNVKLFVFLEILLKISVFVSNLKKILLKVYTTF